MMSKHGRGRRGKPWRGTLRSDSGLVCRVPGPQGCAGVHPGAVRERFGELSELRNRLSEPFERPFSVSGSFRTSEIGSRSPLSDRFGGMFDFKASRWHCGAHAMAENTSSNEACSTLWTNALDVCFFSRVGACGLWPGNRLLPPSGSCSCTGGLFFRLPRRLGGRHMVLPVRPGRRMDA